MNLLKELNKQELKELLVKCWMTHDGSWFYNSVKEFGIDTANKLNKGAITNLAPFEINRIKKAMGMENAKITTFEQLKKFIDAAFSVLKGDFMKFTYTFSEKNHLHWEMSTCFAFEGMKLIGITDNYECGVIFRVCCWLDTLGIKYKIEPEINKCLLYSQEKCTGDIKFNLK
ncbi:MAG: DUF6125 family protein [Candidatus Hodarchaeota archaeon]